MSTSFIAAIDQGTTGSTVLILELQSQEPVKIISKANVPFEQHFPAPGWVEHDLEQIWSSVLAALEQSLNQAAQSHPDIRNKISAFGITNQRETLCVFDKATGKPIRRALVWQDKRSEAICQELSAAQSFFQAKTGLVVDPYFTGTKLSWLIRNDPELATQLASSQALWGTIDTYLIYRLTGAQAYVTEPSNASRTLMFNIHTGVFDKELLQKLGIPEQLPCPRLHDSAGHFGQTKNLPGLPDGIPISGVLGDQQAALAGQNCFEPGTLKCTYGTGGFLLMNTGKTAMPPPDGLLTTVAWSLSGSYTYAIEGATFIAGAAVQYYRDQLKILDHAAASETKAAKVPAAPDVYFVPALSGLGAPYWQPHAKGALLGLSRGTDQATVIRALLEGICFSINDLVETMLATQPTRPQSLKVDGGACENNLLLQIQANLLDLTLDRPQCLETTALGAGLFAALGVGIYNDMQELHTARAQDRLFVPEPHYPERQAQLSGWKRAINAVKVFSET